MATSSSSFSSSSSGTSTPVLTSLPALDELRNSAAFNDDSVQRPAGSNLNVFKNDDGDDNDSLVHCHLSAVLPFTQGDDGNKTPIQWSFEEAAAITLAAQHLNSGNGSLVPEIDALSNTCPIRFTVEFADSGLQALTALNHVVSQTTRTPSQGLPCAFLGAYRSAVSIPMSTVTGLRGYPQVSGGSTSANLEDSLQYPLFARTIPSDSGNAIPIIRYLREVLQIKHLAVMNVNDAYGNGFVDGLRKASTLYAPDFTIHQIRLEEDNSNIPQAIQSFKEIQFTYCFAIVFTAETHDALLTEAYHKGVAGTGIHNWLFADSFGGVLVNRKFEENSPLHLSYRGVGLLEASGGIEGIGAYDNFVSKMAEMSNPHDLEYLFLQKYPTTNSTTQPSFADDPSFLQSFQSGGFVPFLYDATISLGLSACDAVANSNNNSNSNSNNNTTNIPVLTGADHFQQLVRTSFTGVTGRVEFDRTTGTRDLSTVLYKVSNFQPVPASENLDDGFVTFEPTITDIFQDATWKSLEPYLFNDGTNKVPNDIPQKDHLASLTTPNVLFSLPLLDKYRVDGSNIIRSEGSNVNYFVDEEIATVHLSVFLPFTDGSYLPVRWSFEESAAIALAAHHLNAGDGSIVPEIEGINQKCPIRFSVEYTDTEFQAGVALNQIVEQTNRQPEGGLPSAFIGAYRSAISIPTAIFTGLNGYPQISAESTSAILEDTAQFPLFARTVPSDHGNVVPTVRYFREVLGVTRLAVINVNDAYGNSYVEGMRLAAQKYAPDFIIHQIPLDNGDSSIQDAIDSFKRTQFTMCFGVFFTVGTHDALMTEAYEQGVAGNGLYNWFFATSFDGILDNRDFEENSPLHLTYQGTGFMGLTGGFVGIDAYDNFAGKMAELANPYDLEYLVKKFPSHDHPNFKDNDVFADSNFLTELQHGAVPFSYEAVVALGLSACSAIDTTTSIIPSLSGKKHYDLLKQTEFTGITGNVKFDNTTGTRDASSPLYRVANFAPKIANGRVSFEPTITSVYKDKEWEERSVYVYNDGTTEVPSDIPPQSLEDNAIHLGTRVTVLAMFSIIVLMSAGFGYWTWKHETSRVIQSSQPFFLYIILAGVVIFSSAIVPFQVDQGIASVEGCTVACNFVPWFLSLGFSIFVSALFTKLSRINRIIRISKSFRRIRVTVNDVVRPMIALLSANILVLSLMVALDPIQWTTYTQTIDVFGRTSESFSQCAWDEQMPYLLTLGAINILALCYTIYEVHLSRHLSTEYAETQSIFRVTITMLSVLFVGGPVLVLAQDTPDAGVFVGSAIVFVVSSSTILFMFVPKMRFYYKHKGDDPISKIRVSWRNGDSRDLREDSSGLKVLSSKSKRELLKKVRLLEDKLRSFKIKRSAQTECTGESGTASRTNKSEVSELLNFESEGFGSGIISTALDRNSQFFSETNDTICA